MDKIYIEFKIILQKKLLLLIGLISVICFTNNGDMIDLIGGVKPNIGIDVEQIMKWIYLTIIPYMYCTNYINLFFSTMRFETMLRIGSRNRWFKSKLIVIILFQYMYIFLLMSIFYLLNSEPINMNVFIHLLVIFPLYNITVFFIGIVFKFSNKTNTIDILSFFIITFLGITSITKNNATIPYCLVSYGMLKCYNIYLNSNGNDLYKTIFIMFILNIILYKISLSKLKED